MSIMIGADVSGGDSSLADQVRRVAEAMRNGTPPLAPAEYSLPVERYVSDDRFQAERDVLFRRHPLVVALSAELAGPGSCLAVDLPGLPLLLARDEAGTLRAFLNVCRHRGIRVLNEDGVCRRTALVCPYHNWTYRLDGSLKGMPDASKGFPNIDRKTHGLKELPAAERSGLVFVLPDPAGGPLDPEACLGGLDGDVADLGLAGGHVFRRQAKTFNANWKLMLDSFMEAYHVPRLHKDTVAGFFPPDGDLYVDRVGQHVRVVLPRREMDPAAPVPAGFADLRQLVTVDWILFPNTVLVLSPDFVTVITFLPVAPDRTVVIDRMVRPKPPADEREAQRAERSYRLIHETLLDTEDWWVAESTQAGLATGVNDSLLVGRNEGGIRLMEQMFDEALDAA